MSSHSQLPSLIACGLIVWLLPGNPAPASPRSEVRIAPLKPSAPAREPGLNEGGIGLYIVIDANHAMPRVYAAIKGGPAEQAGVVADPNYGDLITAINGVSTRGKPRTTIIAQIRGQVGSKVFLTLERKGALAPVTTPIVRKLLAPLIPRSPPSAPMPQFQRLPPKKPATGN